MVGGAPVTAGFAKQIGADAVAAVDLAKELWALRHKTSCTST